MTVKQHPAFGVWNGYAPAGGPKAMPYEFDFSVDAEIIADLLDENTRGVMGFVQGMYVDNSDNPNPFTIIFKITNQRIVVPANSQGTYPILAPDQTAFVASTTPGDGIKVLVQFLNVPTAYTQWGPISVNANISPTEAVSITDASTTLAVASTSQQILAANANRKYLYIENPTSEVESLWINYGGAAQEGVDSVELTPGESLSFGGVLPSDAIEFIAVTAGHVIIVKEG